MKTEPHTSPHARGVWYAVMAALAFGLGTPLVARFAVGLGPFTTAACLYAGAAVVGATLQRFRRDSGHALRRNDWMRVAAMAAIGATAAPALLAFGLQDTGATSASLVLNLEAIFTLGLAALVYKEPLGCRAAVAAGAMLGGGTLLVLQTGDLGEAGVGILAVVAATGAWGVDNTLSRPLAEARPLVVVAVKATLGASFSVGIALATGEPAPEVGRVALLMAVGAVGYGGSLAFYLTAQRLLGAGRTGSVFALGPFIGAVAAIALGDRDLSWATAVAAGLFALGVWLHLSEAHAHAHVHEAMEHEHFHRHDDGHHEHAHGVNEVVPQRGHSHWHIHPRLEHDHAHAPDLHHLHAHPKTKESL